MILLESGEMYLETILVLQQRNSKVRSIDISEEMQFSKPSVSRAIKLLKTNGYINVDAQGYITFTEKGKEVAEDIYDRHQVLTECLISLGVSEELAAKDACKIEHDLSKETFAAIKKHMKKYLDTTKKQAKKQTKE
ncbi:MAG: metal-dependent transcriptional regulator [Lachnospiraceae bacterium]|nr:metal-dependent transcriptional regulator [Lachnospiraceae bacterium]MBR3581717.1 metal-dependent transcriptional regulator [Lachnospiraceae bacterium]MBR4540898.1 metal-dependent transcriptional regulator [Lachnospiraceae bacterium]